MHFCGKTIKYGDHVDTDVIIPARYLSTAEPAELAKHCMEDIDPDFLSKAPLGKIMVGGHNFGCGSSREHAPLAIQGSGIACIIAADFARIFYRNALNIGLAIAECPQAAAEIRDGDEVAVDFATGKIENISQGKSYQMTPFPTFMMELIEAGGLVAYTQKRLGV